MTVPDVGGGCAAQITWARTMAAGGAAPGQARALRREPLGDDDRHAAPACRGAARPPRRPPARVGGDAGAEAAAHVGHRHVDGVLLEAERAGNDVAGGVGACSGAQMRTPPVSRSGAARVAEGSRGHGGHALVDEAALHHDLRAGERALVGVAGTAKARLRAARGTGCGARRRARARGRRDLEGLVLDLDELGRAPAARASRPRRPTIASPGSAPVVRERRAHMSSGAMGRGRREDEVEVGAGEHGRDSRSSLGVDAQECARGPRKHEVPGRWSTQGASSVCLRIPCMSGGVPAAADRRAY